jgi:hypothetical protein
MPPEPNAEYERLVLDRLAAWRRCRAADSSVSPLDGPSAHSGRVVLRPPEQGSGLLRPGQGWRDQFLGACRNGSPHAHGKSRVPGGSQPAVSWLLGNG